MRKDVPAKFEQMGRAGALANDVFVEVHALAEEQVERGENR